MALNIPRRAGRADRAASDAPQHGSHHGAGHRGVGLEVARVVDTGVVLQAGHEAALCRLGHPVGVPLTCRHVLEARGRHLLPLGVEREAALHGRVEIVSSGKTLVGIPSLEIEARLRGVGRPGCLGTVRDGLRLHGRAAVRVEGHRVSCRIAPLCIHGLVGHDGHLEIKRRGARAGGVPAVKDIAVTRGVSRLLERVCAPHLLRRNDVDIIVPPVICAKGDGVVPIGNGGGDGLQDASAAHARTQREAARRLATHRDGLRIEACRRGAVE